MATKNKRVGGIAFLKVNGEQLPLKGNYTYNLGRAKREAVVGHDGVHGFKAIPQTPMIEGEITDSADLNLQALADQENATVTLELYNGKTIVLRDGWFAGDATGNTEEGNIDARWEGMSCEEI